MGVYGYGMNGSSYLAGYSAGYGGGMNNPMAMNMPMGMNSYGVTTMQPAAVTAYGNSAYGGAYQSGFGMPMQSNMGMTGFNSYGYPAGQMGLGQPSMLTASAMPQSVTNVYATGYPSAYNGNPALAMPSVLPQNSMPFGQTTSTYYPSAAQLGISNPFSVAPAMQTQGHSSYPSGYGPAQNPRAGQFVTRQEMNDLLQYVQSLETKQMMLETELASTPYGYAGDPSMQDIPPDDVSLYAQDPYMAEDPSLYADPMMYDPEQGNGMGPPQYPAWYEDPSTYDAAYSGPGHISPSMYNSSPLNQAVAQYRDTMNPQFSMNGELTEDAKSEKDAKNKDKPEETDGNTT